MAHAAEVTHAGMPAEPGMLVYNKKLGMWVFLCSEVMFFTALIGAYIILRFGATEAWPIPGETLNISLTAINTFILICSSVSMVKAYAAVVDGDQAGLKKWLLVTVIGGSFFVGVQIYEYYSLITHEHFLPSTGLFGATFFTMTGFHGFHVTCGVIAMIWLTIQAFKGRYTQENFFGVEVVGLYWHFVDLVWIILFTIVYLI